MSDNYTQDFIDEVKGALNSGSSGGVIIDQTARSDISNHVANSGVHVTVDDKTSWNNKAESSDIPTTLPASGGNADTVNNHTVETDVPVNAIFTDTINSDTVSVTAGIVTLDGLQGGVPFSDITIFNGAIGQGTAVRVCGQNIMTFMNHLDEETISGVTFTRSPDGTITANGTATAVAQYLSDTITMTDGETYTLMGCPSGGSSTGYSITDQTSASISDLGSGKVFTYSADSFGAPKFKIRIASGYTCNNVVFRPVLCKGSAVITNVTPDSNPYEVVHDIRQQDGVNTVSISYGDVRVTGVRKNKAIKRAWDKLDELATAIIVSNGETTE